MTAREATLSIPGPFAAPPCCEDETWRPVPDWGGYEASTCGQLRRLPRLDASGRLDIGGPVARCPDKRPGKGYLYATLRDGKRCRRAAVAVLVLEAHCGRRPGKDHQACHGNGIRTDNHRINLRWDTIIANRADRERHRTERLVTAPVTGGAGNGPGRHGSKVRAGAGAFPSPSRPGVTSDGLNGTGSSCFPSYLSFVLPSVQSLRSLRSRRRSH